MNAMGRLPQSTMNKLIADQEHDEDDLVIDMNRNESSDCPREEAMDTLNSASAERPDYDVVGENSTSADSLKKYSMPNKRYINTINDQLSLINRPVRRMVATGWTSARNREAATVRKHNMAEYPDIWEQQSNGNWRMHISSRRHLVLNKWNGMPFVHIWGGPEKNVSLKLSELKSIAEDYPQIEMYAEKVMEEGDDAAFSQSKNRRG